MDWDSRYVLTWEVSVIMDDDFYVNALKSAWRGHKTPEIFNTDQGAQYTGKAFTGGLKDHGVQISMDSKGRSIKNFSSSLPLIPRTRKAIYNLLCLEIAVIKTIKSCRLNNTGSGLS